MTNAWIQRLLTLGVPLLWWIGAYQLWPSHRLGAALCLLAPVLIAPLLEAVQFILLWIINRHDPSPRASVAAHVRAWWGELRTTVKVFNWWQPFRTHTVPDHLAPAPGQRGVVLVHGFFCNRAFWIHWMRRLRQDGRVFVAVNLEPAFGSIDAYVQTINSAVHKVYQATGLPPVLVGHSMGGLAIRAWLQAMHAARPGETVAHRVITLGTPHHGTWLGRLSHAENGRQMRLHSTWINSLEKAETSHKAIEFVCFYSDCDNIVFPVSSGRREGADNRLVHACGHIDLAHDAQVMQACWALMK